MGGGKIKDATATPQDVMTGKVFYNNDGRQVGIKNEAIKGLKVFNLSIPKKIYRETSTDMNIDSYIRSDDIGNLFVDMNQYERTFRCIKIQSFNFNKILGFELDGTMTLNDNAKIRKGKALIHEFQGSRVNENSGMLNLAIVFYNNCVYLGHETYEYMEEFTSIEPDFAQNLKVYYI